MRILVTGCAGFIGSNVVEQLIARGDEVVGVDNLNHSYDVRLKHWRLDKLKNNQGFHFHDMDITEPDLVMGVASRGPFDSLINLAARAGVRQSLEDPKGYFDTNLSGTLNLLEACKTTGISKFVQASTSSVYGDAPGPFVEVSRADAPLSPYAGSKKAAENLCHVYHHVYGLDVSVLRYFTVFGPAGRPDMAIYRFIRWIAESEKITLYGDGNQSRDFTYVSDIARGTIAALRPLGFEVINLGADRPTRISDIIAILEESIGNAAIIGKMPSNKLDVEKTWASVDKAKEILGWEPTMDLVKGLHSSVNWYLEQRDWAKDINLWV